jgi:hypothetical protein
MTFRNFREHPRRCFDALVADRMFWGTDITRMPCSWRLCVRVFTAELPWLQGRDLEAGHGRGPVQPGGLAPFRLSAAIASV